MGKRRGILSLALLVLCFSLCYLGVPASVSAIEPGTAAMYPGGNEDFFAGALPPAGTKVFINYLTYYDSTQANGNSGHQAQINFGGKLGVLAFTPALAPAKIDLLLTKKAPYIVHIDIAQSLGRELTVPAGIAFRYNTARIRLSVSPV